MTEKPKRRGRPRKVATQDFQVRKQVKAIAPLVTPGATEIVSTAQLNDFARIAQIRQVVAAEFLCDPDMRTVDYHHGREDRPWRKIVSLTVMKRWATEDRWFERRRDFWQQIQDRILSAQKHDIVTRRLAEIKRFEETRDALGEYMQPLRDRAGNIRRFPELNDKGKPHELAGLAIFPVEMPKLDRLVKSIIELDRHVMLKRGEIPDDKQTETADGAKPQAKPILALSGQENFSAAERRAMADALIKERQGDDDDDEGEFEEPPAKERAP